MQDIMDVIEQYLSQMPLIRMKDILEMIIISVLIYHVILWMKNTKAWSLLKGIAILLIFYGVAAVFRLNTITWLVNNSLNVIIIAGVIIFQPELRKAMEQLGRQKIFTNVFSGESTKVRDDSMTERTINEIVKACNEMGKSMTGALIVIENTVSLAEYERPGIALDALVTSQLLINIFEHNTPLHDGAGVVRGNRITSATCYLPLSDNNGISKELGTRHRAGIGVSEATDSYTVIVSEETGMVSLAVEGRLLRGLDTETLKAQLSKLLPSDESSRRRKLWKGRQKNERETDKKLGN